MEELSRHLGFNRTLALICCIFFIFLHADGERISTTAGSPVTLHCHKNSTVRFTQLTWKRNGESLFTFRSNGTSNSSCVTLNSNQRAADISCVRFHAAATLNLNMSTSESRLYALIIESAHETHAGNYTCETSTIGGVVEEKWELEITEGTGNPFKVHIAAAVIVPCVCFLIIIIVVLIRLRGVCKRRSQNITQSPTQVQQAEDIYENTLELEAHRQGAKSRLSSTNPGLSDMNHVQ